MYKLFLIIYTTLQISLNFLTKQSKIYIILQFLLNEHLLNTAGGILKLWRNSPHGIWQFGILTFSLARAGKVTVRREKGDCWLLAVCEKRSGKEADSWWLGARWQPEANWCVEDGPTDGSVLPRAGGRRGRQWGVRGDEVYPTQLLRPAGTLQIWEIRKITFHRYVAAQ